MKRMLLAAAAVVGLFGLVAAGDKPVKGVVQASGCEGCGTGAQAAPAADYGYAGPAMGFGGGPCPECERAKRFGTNPLLKRLAFWKKDTECGTCGIGSKLKGGLCGNNCGGRHGGAGYGGFDPYPGGVPGTLVFPQHPYARSPRDWFEK